MTLVSRLRGADLTHHSVEVTDIWGAGSGTAPTGKSRDGEAMGAARTGHPQRTAVEGDQERTNLLGVIVVLWVCDPTYRGAGV